MKKNLTFEYVGCFFEWSVLDKVLENIEHIRLDRQIKYPHITFSYMPEFIDETLWGEKVRVRITGYGNDGENEGFKVELVSEDGKLQKEFAEIEVPHITISVSETGKPINTRYLEYIPVEPVEVEGVYGGYNLSCDSVEFAL